MYGGCTPMTSELAIQFEALTRQRDASLNRSSRSGSTPLSGLLGPSAGAHFVRGASAHQQQHSPHLYEGAATTNRLFDAERIITIGSSTSRSPSASASPRRTFSAHLGGPPAPLPPPPPAMGAAAGHSEGTTSAPPLQSRPFDGDDELDRERIARNVATRRSVDKSLLRDLEDTQLAPTIVVPARSQRPPARATSPGLRSGVASPQPKQPSGTVAPVAPVAAGGDSVTGGYANAVFVPSRDVDRVQSAGRREREDPAVQRLARAPTQAQPQHAGEARPARAGIVTSFRPHADAMLMEIVTLLATAQRTTPPHVPPHVRSAFERHIVSGAYFIKYPASGGSPHERFFAVRVVQNELFEREPQFLWALHDQSWSAKGRFHLGHLNGLITGTADYPGFARYRSADGLLLKGPISDGTRAELPARLSMVLQFCTPELHSMGLVCLDEDQFRCWSIVLSFIADINAGLAHTANEGRDQ